MTFYFYGPPDYRRKDSLTIRGAHAIARTIDPQKITRIVRRWTGHNYRRRVASFTLSDGRIIVAEVH
jgi:hypothetical protein